MSALLVSKLLSCLHYYYVGYRFFQHYCKEIAHSCDMLQSTNIFSQIKGNTLVLFLCIVVLGASAVVFLLILCRNNTRELQLFFYVTHYCPFPLFLFVCLSFWQSYFFLGASIVCVYNQSKEDSRISFVNPLAPQRLNDLNVSISL